MSITAHQVVTLHYVLSDVLSDGSTRVLDDSRAREKPWSTCMATIIFCLAWSVTWKDAPSVMNCASRWPRQTRMAFATKRWFKRSAEPRLEARSLRRAAVFKPKARPARRSSLY